MTRWTHCIVHAGLHKTGTTSIQYMLAARRAALAAAGFSYPALGRNERDHNALAHRLAICSDVELPALRARLSAVPAGLGKRPDGTAVLLLSAEEFSTRICNPDPWAGFDDGAYWERRRQYLARLRSVLPEGAPIEVFLCLRDHESYAHALYATKVLSGKVDGSFMDFVRRCAPIFDYRRQAEVLAETLGPVRLQSFDALRGDLANRSFAWMGLPIRVEHTPRLRPTPTLDLVHWLARSAQSGEGEDERKRRVVFCRDHGAKAGLPATPVRSFWASEEQRQEFLGRCRSPPLEGGAPPAAAGSVADPLALERRAEEIEAGYRQWLRTGGHRKPWIHFWRHL